jgi:hypothetical protein
VGIGKIQYQKTYNFTHGTYSRPHNLAKSLAKPLSASSSQKKLFFIVRFCLHHSARNATMTPEIIDTPEGPPDLPRIPGTRQSLHALARVTHSLPRCKNPRPLEPKSSGKENLNTGCGNGSPTTSAAAKMKFTIPFPNNNNVTKGAYFSSSSTTRRVITIKGWSCDKCTF